MSSMARAVELRCDLSHMCNKLPFDQVVGDTQQPFGAGYANSPLATASALWLAESRLSASFRAVTEAAVRACRKATCRLA